MVLSNIYIYLQTILSYVESMLNYQNRRLLLEIEDVLLISVFIISKQISR
jgi:hypothetical protein